MKRIAAPKRRGKIGPPFVDIAGRLRHLVWYQYVTNKTSDSDAELDRKYVQLGRTEEPTRAFTYIRRRAVDPHWQDATGRRRNFSLVEALAEDFEGSRELYFSRLWELVAPTTPTFPMVTEIIESISDQLGLFRASDVAPLESAPAFKRHPAFVPFPDPSYRSALRKLIERPTADHLALLGALYLEAIGETALEQAILLRELLREGVQRFINQNRIRGLAEYLLVALIEDRLIARRWESPKQMVWAKWALTDPAVSKIYRKRQIKGFMLAAYAFLFYQRRRRDYEFPLVPRTGPISSLKRSSKALRRLKKEQDRSYWTRRLYSGEGPIDPLKAYGALQEYFFRPPPHNKGKRRKRRDDLERLIG